MLDGGMLIVGANVAFSELFRTSPAKLRNSPLQMLGPVVEPLISLVERVRAQGGTIAARDLLLHVQVGVKVRADLIASAVEDVIILVEIHQLAPESNTAAARWSQTLRGLAHEVKNPLAGMRGAAQLLGRRVSDAESTQLAALIVNEADRLAALADRLLQARARADVAEVNLHAVTERARALIVAETAVRSMVECDYDPSLPALNGDADRLEQLVLNLLRNALQANAKHIQMRTRAERNVLIGDRPVRLAIRLDVVDDGDGVPESLRETLFLPMVSGRANGTGLGLALAQQIAHEHGGAIAHDGITGRTVFTLLLPLENTDA
jgi:two-component system, NtrC family, nitrogen regulation sensor histidine kinase GlnL